MIERAVGRLFEISDDILLGANRIAESCLKTPLLRFLRNGTPLALGESDIATSRTRMSGTVGFC